MSSYHDKRASINHIISLATPKSIATAAQPYHSISHVQPLNKRDRPKADQMKADMWIELFGDDEFETQGKVVRRTKEQMKEHVSQGLGEMRVEDLRELLRDVADILEWEDPGQVKKLLGVEWMQMNLVPVDGEMVVARCIVAERWKLGRL